MSIYGNPIMLGGGGGGGAVDRTLQNSSLINTEYTKEGYIGGFDGAFSRWQPYNSAGTPLDVDWSQPWTLHLRLKFTALETTRRECLYGCSSSNVYFGGTITAEVHTGDNWWFGFSTSGSAWDNQILISTSDVPYAVGTVYTIDVEYNGTTVSVTVSDGTHTGSDTTTPSQALYHNSNYLLAFGNIAQSSSLYSRYTYFDPNDCYIESNGVRVWGSKGNNESVTRLLPDTYQQIEYIQSSGTQWIDTGVKINPNYSTEVEFCISELTTEYDFPFGCREENGWLGYNGVFFGNTTTGAMAFRRARSSSDTAEGYTTTLTKDQCLNTYHTVSLMKKVALIDGTTVNTFNDMTSSDLLQYPMFLFALDASGTAPQNCYSYIKMRYAKIWNDSGYLLRHFIPCYRKIDNAVGMYDVVFGGFYANGGTGTFTGGPAV